VTDTLEKKAPASRGDGKVALEDRSDGSGKRPAEPAGGEPFIRRFGRAAGRFARAHMPFLVLTGAAIVLRVLVSLAFRPSLMFVGDSYGYLLRATEIRPGIVRPSLYPLFLAPFQRANWVGWVPVIQHGMGILMGIGIYALLRRLGIGKWTAAIGAAPIMLDAYQLNIEQFIMAETLFGVLMVGAVLLVAWPKKTSPVACFGAGALLAGAALTRGVGLALVVPVFVYILLRQGSWIRRGLSFGAAAVALAIPLMLYASWFQSLNGSYAISGYDGYFLYGRVATFADCNRSQIPAPERVLCDPRPASQRPFANFYVWNSQSPVHRLPAENEIQVSGILKDFSVRVIKHQPLDYLGVVVHDFLHFFAPGHYTSSQDEPVQMWQFAPAMPILEHIYLAIPPCLSHYTAGCDPAQSVCFHGSPDCLDLLEQPPPSRGLAEFLRGYQRVGYTPGPLLAVALILGLVGLWGQPRVRGRPLRAESFLFVSLGVVMLLIPVMTVMFDYRYMVPALALLPPAGLIGGTVIARRLQDRWGRESSVKPARTATVRSKPTDADKKSDERESRPVLPAETP